MRSAECASAIISAIIRIQPCEKVCLRIVMAKRETMTFTPEDYRREADWAKDAADQDQGPYTKTGWVRLAKMLLKAAEMAEELEEWEVYLDRDGL